MSLSKLRALLLILATVIGVLLIGAPNASAVNRVCHGGSSTQHAVVVLEQYGASYLLYPGQCTSGVQIVGFRPDGSAWQARYSRNFGTYTSTYKAGQWTSTLGYNVTILSVSRSGFGGGGSF